MSKKTNYKTGMTLIELTVTMLIIGIVAAVAVPKISGAVTTTRLDTATLQMVADFEAARRYAISTSSSQQIQVIVANNEYKLKNMPDINHPGISEYVVDFDAMQGTISITAVNFNSTDSMTFDMYGKPNHGGTVVIQSGSQTKTITIEATTGKVTVL